VVTSSLESMVVSTIALDSQLKHFSLGWLNSQKKANCWNWTLDREALGFSCSVLLYCPVYSQVIHLHCCHAAPAILYTLISEQTPSHDKRKKLRSIFLSSTSTFPHSFSKAGREGSMKSVIRSPNRLSRRQATPVSYYSTQPPPPNSSSSSSSDGANQPPPPPPPEDKTVAGRSPFQAFVDVLKEEVRKNREWQESVKQLAGERDKVADSETMRRAKEVYERARVRRLFLL
jgi:hypothetical protein